MTQPQQRREITLVDEGALVSHESPGSVRVYNWSDIEEPLTIAAYGMSVLWVGLGLYHLVKTIRRENKTPKVVVVGLFNTCSFIVLGLVTPGILGWCLATVIESNSGFH